MSDIFHEVDEEVRRDKAAEFWKKYQNLILAGAALIVLAAAGFRYWQYERDTAGKRPATSSSRRSRRSRAASSTRRRPVFDKIAAEAPSGYRALAQMTAAGAKAQSDPQGAIGAFDAISGDAAIDPLIRDAARLRAGAAQGRHRRRRTEGRGGADLAFGRGRALPAHRASRISRRSRSRATTMTTPPSSSTSCSAIPKSRRTSGNWRAVGSDSWPRTDRPRRSNSRPVLPGRTD